MVLSSSRDINGTSSGRKTAHRRSSVLQRLERRRDWRRRGRGRWRLCQSPVGRFDGFHNSSSPCSVSRDEPLTPGLLEINHLWDRTLGPRFHMLGRGRLLHRAIKSARPRCSIRAEYREEMKINRMAQDPDKLVVNGTVWFPGAAPVGRCVDTKERA